MLAEIREQVRKLAMELKVIGLMNVQFAVKDGVVYLIEVNPRAAVLYRSCRKRQARHWLNRGTRDGWSVSDSARFHERNHFTHFL